MKRLLTFACSLVLLADTAAYAEPAEPTAQAKAANAAFLLHAVPPAPPAAICLVDTGVNANPDTTSVIARSSMQALDGTDQSPSLHGTQMAMLLAATANSWGTVGFWPSVPIVSFQANQPGSDAFLTSSYIYGIYECNRLSSVHPIKVTLVSVASETALTQNEMEDLNNVLAQARARGIHVVAAGGNLHQRPLGTPANTPGTLSVGASDAGTGAFCASSATGALILAPGCAIDSADPTTGAPSTSQEGTSAAAAFVAAGLAALRTWRPDLPAQEVERLVSESGTPTPMGRQLNLAGAFAGAGLQSITLPPSPPPPPPPPPTAKVRLVQPRVTVRLRRGVLTVRSTNRPAGTRMLVRVYSRSSKGKLRRIATRERAATTIKLRVKRWARVTIRFTDPTGARTVSPVTKKTRR